MGSNELSEILRRSTFEANSLDDAESPLFYGTLISTGMLLIRLNFDDPSSLFMQRFVERHGHHCEHTNEANSKLWDITPLGGSIARSHSFEEFDIHTDSSFDDPPPQFISLHVIRQDLQGGGISQLVCANRVLDLLSAKSRATLSEPIVIRIPREFHKGIDSICAPIVMESGIRYRPEIIPNK